ncbi:hypothetical protein B4096_3642 [Heyndrickxia coagulans]|nr:hypothetical protein B4096_3642 [Heyndrickxia coagulans]
MPHLLFHVHGEFPISYGGSMFFVKKGKEKCRNTRHASLPF